MQCGFFIEQRNHEELWAGISFITGEPLLKNKEVVKNYGLWKKHSFKYRLQKVDLRQVFYKQSMVK